MGKFIVGLGIILQNSLRVFFGTYCVHRLFVYLLYRLLSHKNVRYLCVVFACLYLCFN